MNVPAQPGPLIDRTVPQQRRLACRRITSYSFGVGGRSANRAVKRACAGLAALATLAPAAALPAREPVRLEAALRAHIAKLASDEFGGRAPGTPGEALTLRYLAEQWFKLGLVSGTNDPVNPWFAPVKLVQRVPVRSVVRFTHAGEEVPIGAEQVLVASSSRRALVRNAPVVFVGRLAGPVPSSDLLAGRVALMLDSLPPGADPELALRRPGKLLKAGAAAVVTVLDGARGLDEVRMLHRQAGYALAGEEAEPRLEAYITSEAAARLLGPGAQAKGLDQTSPVPLPITATLEAESREQPIDSHNLIARLPGKDPNAGAILLLAHWDHLGLCAPSGAVDRICNGAVDNASGLAVLTEIARGLTQGKPLQRDVYFLATTAEEYGLLGAHAFADNPPLPLDRIVAAFNIDSPAMARKGMPLSIMGAGRTPLDPAISRIALQMRRRLVPSAVAESYLKRQDGWALLQRDVPAVSVGSGYGDPAFLDSFMAETYHRPGDEAAAQLDLTGAADDAQFLLTLVRWLADPRNYPDQRRSLPGDDSSSATSSRAPG